MKKSALKLTLILLIPAALYVWFTVLTDGKGLLTRMGPYQGRVLDAKTGAPVPNAYVFLSWGSDGMFGPLGCSANHLIRTDSNGKYFSGWRGYRYAFAWGLTGWSPATVSVISEGYRPWGVSKDGPQYPSSYYFVPPNGSPFSVSQIHDIGLTPMGLSSYTDQDVFHLDNCATLGKQSIDIVAYLRMRSRWNDRCHSGSQAAMNPEEYIRFGSYFGDETAVRTADSRLTIMLNIRQQLQEAVGFGDELKASGRTDLIPPIEGETRAKVCEVSNIRIPELEDAGK